MDEQPVRRAEWSAADFAELEQYNAPVWVDIFEGQRPPVCVDARGYEMWAFLGETGNPLVQAAMAAYQDQQRNFVKPDRDPVEVVAEVRALQDKILAAILVHPRYCDKTHFVQGRPPQGQLWYGSFTGDQRRKLVDFFYNGAEACKSVRVVSAPDGEPLRPGDGVPPTAEPDPDSVGAAVSPLVAGRSGVAVEPGADGPALRDVRNFYGPSIRRVVG